MKENLAEKTFFLIKRYSYLVKTFHHLFYGHFFFFYFYKKQFKPSFFRNKI